MPLNPRIGVYVPMPHREQGLGPVARERIKKGHLPRVEVLRLWGGRGTGQLCALCDKPITPDEIEYEVECCLDRSARTFWFHIACQRAWQLERDRLEKD